MCFFRMVALTVFFLMIVSTYGNAETIVGGNITEDTVWDLVNSPYIVNSTVQVLEDVTLEIKPGVVIRFNEHTGLNIGGELVAIGNDNKNIYFNPIKNNVNYGYWHGITFFDTNINTCFDEYGNYKYGSILKYCNIDNGGIYIKNTNISIKYCEIKNCYVALKLKSDTVFDNESGVGLVSSKIYNNQMALDASNIINIEINNSIITYNENTTWGSAGIDINACNNIYIINTKIIKNIVNTNFNDLIRISNTDNFTINNSEIAHNIIKSDNLIEIGIDKDGLFNYNNVYNNTCNNGNHLVCSDSGFNASSNWWGTTDKTIINDNITDYFDDLELGKVVYEPIATQPYNFSVGSITGKLKNYTTLDPIINGSVSCSGGQATTNSSGHYKIKNLTPGNYTLTASAPLYHSKTVENVEVHAGQETTQDFEVEKKTTGALVGKVLNVKDLSPVENVQVDLQSSQNQYQYFTTTNGEFNFDDVKAGDYTLNIFDPGYWGISKNASIYIDEISNATLTIIPQDIVDNIQAKFIYDEPLNINSGWNLVGALNAESTNVSSIISKIDQSVISVWKWTDSNWSVFLPEEEDNGTSYAQRKGFGMLETIEPGEGFWVNCQ